MDQKQKLRAQFKKTIFIIKTEYSFSSFREITKLNEVPDDLWFIYHCGYLDGEHVNHESFLYMDQLTNKLDYMSIDELSNAVDVVNNILNNLKYCFAKLERK